MTDNIKTVLRENEELKGKCALFQAMFDATSDQIYLYDSEIKYLYVNSPGAKILGLELQEILGKTWRQAGLLAEVMDPLEDYIRKVFKTGWPVREETRLSLSGEAGFFEHILTPIRDQAGKVCSVLATVRDTTERKWYELALKETTFIAEKRADELNRIFASISEGLIIYDQNGNIIRMNEVAREVFGYIVVDYKTLRSEHGVQVNICLPDGTPFKPEEDPAYKAVHGEVVRNVEVQIIKNPGTTKWLIVSAAPLKDAIGEITGAALTFKDITERKRMEEALRQSEERFHSVLDNSVDVIYRLNVQSGCYAYISPSSVAVVGFSPDELMMQDNVTALAMIHPDDLPAMQAAQALLQNTGLATVEYRQRAKNGDYRWLSNHMSLIRDSAGRPLYQDGNIRDITEGKQFEETLQTKQEELTTANEELQAQQEELYTNYQELQSQSEEIQEYVDAVNQARDEAERRATVLDATLSAIAMGVIIFNNAGEVNHINEFARKVFGHDSGDYDLVHQDRLARIKFYNSDGLPYKTEEGPLYRALRGEVICDEEVMITGVPERPVWLSATFAPIRDNNNNLMGVILVFTDITERKRKLENLLSSERELLKVTLNSLNEAVVTADTAERIIFINQAAVKLTGYTQDEAIGEPVNKIFYILDDQTSEPIDQISAQTTISQPVLVTRDLKEIVVSMNSAPIKAIDGQTIGTVFVFMDITEKRKTEQELLKAAKLDSLGILAGGVAHDFNNILAGILANLQLAAIKLKKHQDISKHLEDTIGISRKASNLTKQLLTFAKGGDPVKKSAAIAKLVMETVQFALSGSKSKAEFQLPEDLWVVDIDEGQINQVINNLTINADQAMPTGGILEIYGENVILEDTGKYKPGQYIKLTVKDHGIGIPTEIINEIFDPFFTTKKTGNGLGLSTSYSIIKKHNGYLEVESVPGIGTTFYMLLPASMGELTFKETQKELAASVEAKILLMDDEDAIREVGGEMLTFFGYQVTLARDGQEAIDLYKKAKETSEPFNLVIMDLTVPGGLGGIETMAILRQIDPEIKAVISSGYASDPVMSDYERYGFSGVVIKPYKFDELNEVLNKVIDKKQLPLGLTY
jgi:PAS domain S-box-containing protein